MFHRVAIFLCGTMLVAGAWAQPGGPPGGPGSGSVVVSPVGDVDTFGDDVIYLGSVQTPAVLLQDTCPAPTPGDTNRCIEQESAPAVTAVDESDMATIELPPRSTDSLICFAYTPFHQYSLANNTGSQQLAQQYFRATVAIESDVLDGLNDPGTGDPYNGVVEIQLSNGLTQKTIEPGHFEILSDIKTRHCIGGIISTRALEDQYGLTSSQARDFFREPITLRFGIAGESAMADFVSFFYGIRLYGDS